MAAGSMFLILEHSSPASVIVLGSLAFSVKSVMKSCRSSSKARTRFARGDVGFGGSGFFVGVFAFVGEGFFGVVGPACVLVRVRVWQVLFFFSAIFVLVMQEECARFHSLSGRILFRLRVFLRFRVEGEVARVFLVVVWLCFRRRDFVWRRVEVSV